MAEQIGYVFKVGSRIHHLTCYRVTEEMSTTPRFSREARLEQAPMDKLTDSRSPAPRPMRRLSVKENGSINTFGTSKLQVRGKGTPDLVWQGHNSLSPGFTGSDTNYATMPIQLVES
jgi:hypothetical protein